MRSSSPGRAALFPLPSELVAIPSNRWAAPKQRSCTGVGDGFRQRNQAENEDKIQYSKAGELYWGW
jgi:hypothetical protein